MLDVNDEAGQALKGLLAYLATSRYRFTTITPASHARVLLRDPTRTARSIEDVLGWSLPFSRMALPVLADYLDAAGMLNEAGALCRSRIRVSSLDGDLYVHSAYPTDSCDAVFFGPDSYRFADFIKRELEREPLQANARVLDIGTGTGVGAIVAGKAQSGLLITATDINPAALYFAKINAAHANVPINAVEAGKTGHRLDQFDLILINPPYIIDNERRAYRHGGGANGSGLALRLVQDALPHLNTHGKLLLYAGSAIVDGQDTLRRKLTQAAAGLPVAYREIDPDVFGEELAGDQYRVVDRISLITAVIGGGKLQFPQKDS